MTRVFEFLIAVLIVVGLLVLVAVLLPSSRTITHTTETNHPIRQVYDTISGFQRFRDWHPMRMHDPQIRYTLKGAPRGVGARLEYDSHTLGQGSWEIVDVAEDSEVVIAVDNNQYGENKTHRFLLEEANNGKTVVITQTYSVDYGWDLLGRFAGLYLPRNVGDDMKLGLDNLTGLIATMPNFDYSDIEVARTQVDPANILYVQVSSERNITAVEEAFTQALRDIRQVIRRADLAEAGPPRLITTDFGSETYKFDVVIPVRAVSDADQEAEQTSSGGSTDAADGDTAAAMETTPSTAAADGEVDPCATAPTPAPVMEAPANLPENVLFGQSYGGCALTTVYTGHPAALPLVRDMLRAYAAPHGYIVQGRAFEEYPGLAEGEGTDSVERTFHVYWPIRAPQ